VDPGMRGNATKASTSDGGLSYLAT
jgi:hypothetical protein